MVEALREVAALIAPVAVVIAMVEVPGGVTTLLVPVGEVTAMVEVPGGVEVLSLKDTFTFVAVHVLYMYCRT